MRRRLLLSVIGCAVLAVGVQTQGPAATRTQVVLLGTGTPRALPHRFGPAAAVVVNDTPYLVDFGPGVVRRAAAVFENGVKGLAVARLETAFLTHLHSDHTVGYPDLIFTPWVMGRTRFRVYGPKGLALMTQHVLSAWQTDIEIRTKDPHGRQPVKVETLEIEPGVVYRDANVTVTAFFAPHGDVPHAFGYAFRSADRTIVFSGDTSPNAALVEACQRCDVLVHEVYAADSVAPMPNWLEYRARHHTSTRQLAEIANKTQPGLLVLYHIAQGGPNGPIPDEQFLAEIREGYQGNVVVGRDLGIY
jgi:ribonuclease BN (tRNA processing enzyme)